MESHGSPVFCSASHISKTLKPVAQYLSTKGYVNRKYRFFRCQKVSPELVRRDKMHFYLHIGGHTSKARRCGAASEPRSGCVRKMKGDPRPREDDNWLKPGGSLTLNIQKTPQMSQSSRLS